MKMLNTAENFVTFAYHSHHFRIHGSAFILDVKNGSLRDVNLGPASSENCLDRFNKVVDIFPLDQTPECTLAVDPAYKMARTESACRCDVNPGENKWKSESRLVQKKKTIYPEWEKCWDTAVTEGRILQIVLMYNQTPVVEATMRLEPLVDEKCLPQDSKSLIGCDDVICAATVKDGTYPYTQIAVHKSQNFSRALKNALEIAENALSSWHFLLVVK
ncbi:hypothetical protein TELCIR_14877 [Teladorsagia circumcincta]|uniref:Uncharacterized protein n=1 Tax=Teladorsagia circumcincta TaxID=45464 RepID=A0A2G9TZR8_TELCI|nr:hypothetical protein TELCIR_14877 [Teladorsagia circumcincta]